MQQFQVTFHWGGQQVSGEVQEGRTLLNAAHQLKVPILCTCDGQPSCTDCRVKVLAGFDNLTLPQHDERALMGTVSHITRERLACQSRIQGDVEVEALRLRTPAAG